MGLKKWLKRKKILAAVGVILAGLGATGYNVSPEFREAVLSATKSILTAFETAPTKGE